MSVTFTKLFSSITESTVWCEPDRTRIVWITMLAMADSKGRVWASIPGLANRARVPVDDARIAINTFLSPDQYSRTSVHEGRRIEVIDGGWRLINHEKYRAIRDEESAKEAKRRYINARRERERTVDNVDQCRTESNTVERSRDNAEAEAEAEAVIKPLVAEATMSPLQAKDDPEPINRLNGKKAMIEQVMSYMNKQARRNYRIANPAGKPTSHALIIEQRLKDGYTVEQLKDVIGYKSGQWMGDEKMDQYLTPQTLFRKSNFDKYLAEAEAQ
jgi:uncharacterized phage protein (TIGR02220 family)